MRRIGIGLMLGAWCFVLAGCGHFEWPSPAYYWQSVRGHWAVVRAGRPVDEVLADPATSADLAARLRLAQDIRDFASRALGLPENGSYRRYADLGRPYVLWNVFAAPELSLQLKTWCFPVAGCVPYHGWYAREDAEREARSLREAGWDVQVAGVPAYSTLGWFDDPLLNTFMRLPEGELARLIFHELAHQVVYVPGDGRFNESFATAVEEIGIERWLPSQTPEVAQRYQRFDARRKDFLALLRRTRAALEQAYGEAGDDAQRRAGKARVLAQLQDDYRALRAAWGGWGGYDGWFASNPGNAHLAAVATYTALVPAFRRLHAQECQGDLGCLFERVKALARLDPGARAAQLGL